MEEIWKFVVGYEGIYEVSSLGSVRSIPRTIQASDGQLRRLPGKIMRVTRYRGAAYPAVMLSKSGKYGCKSVHILVCEAFHGARQEGMWVRHLDGDPMNARADNLAWGTPKENMDDQRRHGTRINWASMKHAKLNPDKVREIRARLASGESQSSIGKTFGILQNRVSAIKTGREWAWVR